MHDVPFYTIVSVSIYNYIHVYIYNNIHVYIMYVCMYVCLPTEQGKQSVLD